MIENRSTPSRYSIQQSPLFKLRSRGKLAELLNLTTAEVEVLANAGSANYSFWTTAPKLPKKPRHVEQPRIDLRGVQRRLTRLLARIEPPGYLHSAFRGRSYITNAAVHSPALPTAKIDIRKFFESTDSSRVASAFRTQFLCSVDVAAVLTKLTTIRGHIPTGGNSSTMISFWAYKPMFDEIHALAFSAAVEMSVCVDDMTFTGKGATRRFINSVRIIIRRYGLPNLSP
jgi:RNA-directed DNA polymerase